jgi:hypothetical protein
VSKILAEYAGMRKFSAEMLRQISYDDQNSSSLIVSLIAWLKVTFCVEFS